MRAGIVLVHGYTGSPENLAPLGRSLAAVHGTDAVRTVRLAGHGGDIVPVFDEQTFITSVNDAMNALRKQGRACVLLGHSTGGVIARAALAESGVTPDLLILASTPKRIDAAYLERWSRHRVGKEEMSFAPVASLVSFINSTGKRTLRGSFPVLVLHGAEDELVPVSEAHLWEQGAFSGMVRTALIPGAVHDLFRGPNSALAIDAVMRAVDDAVRSPSEETKEAVEKILSVEPEAGRFLDCTPFSGRHLAASPSGRNAAGLAPLLLPHASNEPTIANIEITTRCNLKCPFCARTMRGAGGADMPKDVFSNILGLIPHAYRITLVGLGETLLHPRVVDFVAEASGQGRRVALVTNAMLLDDPLSRELLKAGLESIAFSIDGATQEIASEVRPGTDLDRVVGNIRKFVELSRSSREISTAVFSAVSTKTVASLGALVDIISGLGVHVMMLTDLNFAQNLDSTLWKNAGDRTASLVRSAVSRAFKQNLPVLSVRGLEEFGLRKRYDKFLLLPPDRLYQRSPRHAWCFSPWQTIPVNVRGEVTLCDCQPEVVAGNLLARPLSEIWNGRIFLNHRSRMVSSDPPDACRICPRF